MINSKQLQANIEVQKIALAKAQSDYNRRVPLGNANLIGREGCNTPATPSPVPRHNWTSLFNNTMPIRR